MWYCFVQIILNWPSKYQNSVIIHSLSWHSMYYWYSMFCFVFSMENRVCDCHQNNIMSSFLIKLASLVKIQLLGHDNTKFSRKIQILHTTIVHGCGCEEVFLNAELSDGFTVRLVPDRIWMCREHTPSTQKLFIEGC